MVWTDGCSCSTLKSYKLSQKVKLVLQRRAYFSKARHEILRELMREAELKEQELRSQAVSLLPWVK